MATDDSNIIRAKCVVVGDGAVGKTVCMGDKCPEVISLRLQPCNALSSQNYSV